MELPTAVDANKRLCAYLSKYNDFFSHMYSFPILIKVVSIKGYNYYQGKKCLRSLTHVTSFSKIKIVHSQYRNIWLSMNL